VDVVAVSDELPSLAKKGRDKAEGWVSSHPPSHTSVVLTFTRRPPLTPSFLSCRTYLRIRRLVTNWGSKWAGQYAIRNTQYATRNTHKYAIRKEGQSGLDVKIAVIRNTQYAVRNAGQKYVIRKMRVKKNPLVAA
jgi:hypothetical protein